MPGSHFEVSAYREGINKLYKKQFVVILDIPNDEAL